MTSEAIAKDATFAGKRYVNDQSVAKNFSGSPGKARQLRDRDFSGKDVAYETGYAPPEELYNPMQGKYKAANTDDKRRNPITWQGVPDETKAFRAAPKPSEELKLQNDRRAGLMPEHYASAAPAAPPERTSYQGWNISNPRMLAWDKGDGAPSFPRGGSKAREVNLMSSSPELLDSIAWPQQRAEQMPYKPKRTPAAGERSRVGDMSGDAAKQLMSFVESTDVHSNQKVKRPVINTREEANQRKFDQVVSAMSVNKTVSDTYSELFKARDRNSYGQLS
jgi:hypothetical protein